MFEPAEIYLDHAASTPLRRAAREAWISTTARSHANPTGSHFAARRALQDLDTSREAVAMALGVSPGEIVFTSGGSEADNMAVRGALSRAGEGALAVCTRAEHHAVLDPVQRSGGILVDVDERGIVDLGSLREVLRSHNNVAIVSVIAVNNETGSITPLQQVARIVRDEAPGALLHTDAVQAMNWIDLAKAVNGYDLVSLTGHKVGSPVGTGALFVREGVELEPLITGGGQERGRRAGTPDLAGAFSFAIALGELMRLRERQIIDLTRLRDRLIDGLGDRLGDRLVLSAARYTRSRAHIAAGIANVCIAGVQSEALLFLIDEAGVRASAASSCSSGAQDPSHVLAAMGVPRDLARGSLRLSLGHTTVESDVERAVDIIAEAVRRLDIHGGG